MILEDLDHLLHDVLVGRFDRLPGAFDVGGRPEQWAAAVVIVEVCAREVGVDDPSGVGFVIARGARGLCQVAGTFLQRNCRTASA
jgi:hypothetical protein